MAQRGLFARHHFVHYGTDTRGSGTQGSGTLGSEISGGVTQMIRVCASAVAAMMLLALPAMAAVRPADVSLAGRPDTLVAQDAGRHPLEILGASGIKPGDRVLDVMAGAGYYSELLGRLVGPGGKVFALEQPRGLADPKAKAAWDDLLARTRNVTIIAALPGEAALPGDLDAAFFHLTYHDLYWTSEKYQFPRTDPALFNARLFRALKKGGIVIVIDHVGRPGGDTRVQVDKVHRIDPAVVRADFEKAGFVFVDAVDVLRVPGDNPDTLVFDPSVRGKTDRFYYRFRKP